MAKRAIWLWRAFLTIIQLDPQTFTRPLTSFAVTPSPAFAFIFDACLEGIGAILSDGGGTRRGVLQVYPLPFHLGTESKYQNFAEFCGILTSILILIAHGAHDLAVAITGDSEVALKWALSTRFRGADHSCTAALIYVLISVRFRVTVAHTTHIEGIKNVACDALSRNYQDVLTALNDPMLVNPNCFYQLHHFPHVIALLTMCDPFLPPIESTADFLVIWDSINHHLDLIVTHDLHPC